MRSTAKSPREVLVLGRWLSEDRRRARRALRLPASPRELTRPASWRPTHTSALGSSSCRNLAAPHVRLPALPRRHRPRATERGRGDRTPGESTSSSARAGGAQRNSRLRGSRAPRGGSCTGERFSRRARGWLRRWISRWAGHRFGRWAGEPAWLGRGEVPLTPSSQRRRRLGASLLVSWLLFSSAAVVIVIAAPAPPATVAASRGSPSRPSPGPLIATPPRGRPPVGAASIRRDLAAGSGSPARSSARTSPSGSSASPSPPSPTGPCLVGLQTLFAGLFGLLPRRPGLLAPRRRRWRSRCTGTAILTGSDAGTATLLGDGLAVLAGACSAAYLVVNRGVGHALPAPDLARLGQRRRGPHHRRLGPDSPAAPLWVPHGRGASRSSRSSGSASARALIGHGSMNWAARSLPVHVVSLTVLLEPAGAAALAWVALGQSFGLGGGARRGAPPRRRRDLSHRSGSGSRRRTEPRAAAIAATCAAEVPQQPPTTRRPWDLAARTSTTRPGRLGVHGPRPGDPPTSSRGSPRVRPRAERPAPRAPSPRARGPSMGAGPKAQFSPTQVHLAAQLGQAGEVARRRRPRAARPSAVRLKAGQERHAPG